MLRDPSLCYNLWVHDERFSKADVVINPDVFPDVSVGDLLEICAKQSPSRNPTSTTTPAAAAADANVNTNPCDNQQHKLVVEVKVIELDILSKQTHLQISIAQNIANLFELQARTDVFVRKIVDPESLAAEFVEFSFRDQYVGRSHMWNIKSLVANSCVYRGKRFSTLGIRACVKDVVVNGVSVPCAYITPFTKTIFRSESAKFFLFIQMSKEMFEFEEDGELFYEKCVYGFLPELFDRWKDGGTNHIVSIILFARVLYNEVSTDANDDSPLSSSKITPDAATIQPVLHRLSRDPSGRLYRDFYRVIVDWEVRSDWTALLIPLRQEFMQFQKEILQQQRGDGSTALAGENSAASQGNILESINLAMNPFDKHYIDRDLNRTGLSIVIVSAGTGIFQVDKKLCRLTSQRMIDNGVALDLVSLSKPPLYSVPLFHFISRDFTLPAYSPNGNSVQNPSAYIPGDGNPMSAGCTSGITGAKQTQSHQTTGSLNGAGSLDNLKMESLFDPLFYDENIASSASTNPDRLFFFEPLWVEVSFWNRKTNIRNSGAGGTDSQHIVRVGKGWEIDPAKNRFTTRCKMHDVQMMGITDNRASISIPYLDSLESSGVSNSARQSRVRDCANVYPLYHGVIAPRTEDASRQHSFSIQESDASPNSLPTPLYRPLLEDYDRYDDNLFSSFDLTGLDSTAATATSYSRFNEQQRMMDPEALRNSQITRDAEDLSPTETAYGSLGKLLPHKKIDFGLRIDANSGSTEVGNFKPSQSSPTLRMMNRQEIDKRRSSSAISTTIAHDNGDHSNTKSYAATFLSPSIAPIYIKTAAEKSQSAMRDTFSHSYSESLRHASPDLYSRLNKGASPGRSLVMQSRMHQLSNPRYSVINPSNPLKNTVTMDSQTRRWHHVDIAHSKSDLMHWKSLCTPACLPLTTDFFPSDEVLKSYQEYTYTVSPADDDDRSPYQGSTLARTDRANVEQLLVELVSQRLSQGFQLTSVQSLVDNLSRKLSMTMQVSSSASSTIRGNGLIDIKTLTEVAAGSGGQLIESEEWQQYYLSLGDHVHQLGYDTYGKNVKVKRYVRTLNYDTSPLNYTCAIWPKNMDCYTPVNFKFAYAPVGMYNWNYLDHLISGYQEEMTDNLRYWRTRFLLIPMDGGSLAQPNVQLNPSNADLDEEELIVAGFVKFIEQFEKVRWTAPESHVQQASSGNKPQPSKKSGKCALEITLSTLDPSSFALDELNKQSELYNGVAASVSMERRESTNPISDFFSDSLSSSSLLSTPTLSRSSTLTYITTQMQKSLTGLSITNRIWNFKLYEQSFIGAEFIDWIVSYFTDIDSRDVAVEFANELLDKGVFEHINQRHKLLDGHYFYRLKSEYVIISDKKTGGAVLETRQQRNNSVSWFLSKIGRPALVASISRSDTRIETTSAPTSPSASLLKMVDPIPLVKSMLVDMDPQRRSNRRETAVLHYDTMHNPSNCYHFQLHWLVCTSKLIQDMLTSWTRVAEKCGLRLVEAPIEQAIPFADDNPFQSVVKIELCIPPPSMLELGQEAGESDDEIPELWFETELLKQHGFVLDMEADHTFPSNIEYSYKKAAYLYTQYVHRSGIAFLQVYKGGYFWVNNRMLLTGGLGKGTPAPNEVKEKFQSFCQDESKLMDFYSAKRAELEGAVVKPEV